VSFHAQAGQLAEPGRDRESALSIVERGCLSRPVPDKVTVQQRARALEAERNARHHRLAVHLPPGARPTQRNALQWSTPSWTKYANRLRIRCENTITGGNHGAQHASEGYPCIPR